MHLDESMKLVGKLLFGMEKGPEVLKKVRPAGQPLVDDWRCLKKLVIITHLYTFMLFNDIISQLDLECLSNLFLIC